MSENDRTQEVSLSIITDRDMASSPIQSHIQIADYSGTQQNTPPPPPPPPEPDLLDRNVEANVEGNKAGKKETFRLNNTKPLEEVKRTLDPRDLMLQQIREKACAMTYSKEKCGPPPTLQNSLFVQFLDTNAVIDDYNPQNREEQPGDGKEKVIMVVQESPVRPQCSEENLVLSEGGTTPRTNSQPLEEKKEEKKEEEKESYWVSDLISYLSEWLYHVARVDEESNQASSVHDSIDLSPSSSFWNEWEWVLSKSEEMAIEHAQKQSEEQAKKVKEELSSLRQQGSRFRHRPFFRKSAAMYFEELDEETRSWLAKGLDPSKRNKIMRDIVKSLKEEWISSFDRLLVDEETEGSEEKSSSKQESFETLFDEKPYEKNLEGAIVSMGLLASHGATKNQGLTAILLSDICWNIWSVLCHSIQKHLDVERLSPEQLDVVAREATKAEKVIGTLWSETAKKAQGGADREGKVVEVWKEEEKVEEEKKLRENLPPDFKYSTYKAEPFMMRKSTLSPHRLTTLRSNLSILLGGSSAVS
uniref:Uncharacterized protein n=1 Tax=Paramoeba aestuarina TaxID=180227 RepID=A0A7S4N6G7_9EUKA|mmetsp:Transcript_11608/g.17584  ORF Transcript_11608/g.17584 Transcript_11608/m.17584 type:complete len:530 (+) Transcript_11608:110-1699(+)